ncbi:MAG: hypothetical protein AAF797_14440 [Planctomycetota bacterium]
MSTTNANMMQNPQAIEAEATLEHDAGAGQAVQPERLPTVQRPPTIDPDAGWWARMVQRIEAKCSKLSVKNNFWHRMMARIFLPLAWRSGIRFRSKAGDPFQMVVPFRRFNKNWYNAMAGAAMLANSEVAGGSYIFQSVGADYTVVCKKLEYKFLRPCLGPAIYQVDPAEGTDLEELKRTKLEFNVTVEMTIYQAVVHKDEKQRRVGKSTATFHVAPKAQLRERKRKAKERSLGVK